MSDRTTTHFFESSLAAVKACYIDRDVLDGDLLIVERDYRAPGCPPVIGMARILRFPDGNTRSKAIGVSLETGRMYKNYTGEWIARALRHHEWTPAQVRAAIEACRVRGVEVDPIFLALDLDKDLAP
jgi:hypothetical protein